MRMAYVCLCVCGYVKIINKLSTRNRKVCMWVLERERERESVSIVTCKKEKTTTKLCINNNF
jgi:hypothetical protein